MNRGSRMWKTRFVPSLESLEGRWVPSCTATMVDLDADPTDDVQDWALVVKGDNAANDIVITDNGGGAVTVTCGGEDITPENIDLLNTKIIVEGGKGEDTITYNLGDVDGVERSVTLDGGQDNDTIDANVGALTGSNLVLAIDGGKGNDTLIADFTGDITDATVDAMIGAGQGDDSGGLTLAGNLVGTSSFAATIEGGQGDDTFNVDVTGGISVDALLSLSLFCGPNSATGVDQFTVNYQGVVNGTLNFTAEGGPGNDIIDATLNLEAGSDGTVDAAVEGGKGDDTLTLSILTVDGDTATINAFVNGGPGTDTINATANVQVTQ